MKSKLRKLLKENQFVFTAETSPPDSGNKDVVLEEVDSGTVSIPGFTFIVGILAVISALIVRKQN